MDENTIYSYGQALLDFNQKLDVGMLDAIVTALYTNPRLVHMANEILVQFKQHPDSWTKVDTILEFSGLDETKTIALSILEDLIKSRWKTLPKEQSDGIKNFIVAFVIKCSSTIEDLVRTTQLRKKLNVVLVQIVKQEWPNKWPEFIPEIVTASHANMSICENNMQILSLLSEEIFDFSAGQMTQAKAKYLKTTFCEQFQGVFMLCIQVLQNATRETLVANTLQTLLRFLNWIPLGFIFETSVISLLVERFLPLDEYRAISLQCLGEIGGISTNGAYDNVFPTFYSSIMEQIKPLLMNIENLAEMFDQDDSVQNLVKGLAIFFTGFFKEHGPQLEADEALQPYVLDGHFYLLEISRVDDNEIFKICLEYWHALTLSLYTESSSSASSSSSSYMSNGGMGGLFLGSHNSRGFGAASAPSPRRMFYSNVLSSLRNVMIQRMAKPEEVLIVEEQGEIIRETMKDTDSINIYKSARETLVYLTNLDPKDTQEIMHSALKMHMDIVDPHRLDWTSLNTLCWAIGSISGAMSEEAEKTFLVYVIKELLTLCENKRGKNNKAVVASNIMYIVGQYPRFLRAHWKFLKTVINKLFEFMHEMHEGVQDMACDTFIKIVQKCRKHFITPQQGESQPFINEILAQMNTTMSDLQWRQKYTFYEAVGYMISSQVEPHIRQELIEQLMRSENVVWDEMVSQASASSEYLKDQNVLVRLNQLLKINIRACTSIGHPFVWQLGKIYYDMLTIYRFTSGMINSAVSAYGPDSLKHQLNKKLLAVKKNILKLIQTWMASSDDPAMVVESFLPPLLEAVLIDYRDSIPDAREPEVLNVMATIINKIKRDMLNDIPVIFDTLFGCTLEMINKDLQQYPEHRTYFFQFLQAINHSCFEAFFSIPAEQFKLVIDSIIWALQHGMREVADTGLTILHDLIVKVSSLPHEISQTFYQTYLLLLMQHVFAALTDSSHMSGFKMHATILSTMFGLLASGAVQVPLFDPETNPEMTNDMFFKQYMIEILSNAFPNLQEVQVTNTVYALSNLYGNLPEFKNTLRDFLVQIKEFAGSDDLYLEETEMNARIKKEKDAQVPGLLNPHEVKMDD